MNFSEVKSAVKHLQKTCNCQQCSKKFQSKEVSVVATTKFEGLFELHCNKCHVSTIVTVVITPEMEITDQATPNSLRTHKGVSQNDILDVKNFLTKFDGNFKKIFNKKS